ncbi:MAG: hypothetical protein U0736_15855 [Gemmataceae bacterium]
MSAPACERDEYALSVAAALRAFRQEKLTAGAARALFDGLLEALAEQRPAGWSKRSVWTAVALLYHPARQAD